MLSNIELKNKKCNCVVIGNYAFVIKDIVFIKVSEKKQKLRIFLRNKKTIKVKINNYIEFDILLDYLAFELKIVDCHFPRVMFNR